MKATLAERVCHKIRIQANGCWCWMGSLDAYGYGNLGYGGRYHKAHRLTYQMFTGDATLGLVMDHLCQNRRCVNPDHLEAVTQGENAKRTGQRRVACPKGHPLTPDNIMLIQRHPSRGRGAERRCRECCRIQSIKTGAKLRAKRLSARAQIGQDFQDAIDFVALHPGDVPGLENLLVAKIGKWARLTQYAVPNTATT